MSEWKVELTFSEGSSNKFWRARVEGSTLYVNYGRIGAAGQTQVKELASADAAESELAKLEREKRKKGYEDAAPGTTRTQDSEEPEEVEVEEPPPPPVPTGPERASFALGGDREVALELVLDGAQIETRVVEKYEDAKTAKEAFDRLTASMLEEGYAKQS